MNSVFNQQTSSTHQVRMRDPDNFPEMLKYTLDQITINEVPKVVGSSAYQTHRYPGDVDVFEQVTFNSFSNNEVDSKNLALDFYVDQLQNIAQRLFIQPEKIQFNDFKAGLDQRFDLNLPDDLTEAEMQELTVALGNKHLLPEDIVLNLFNKSGDLSEYKNYLKELKTVRWNLDEIITGKKKLVGNCILHLKDALEMNTVIKLDVISWFSGRFQSVEAFYNLRYQDNFGNIVEFNPMGNYVQGLLEDIEKYSVKDFYSPLKVLKRMWSLSKVIDCQDMLDAINPVLGSVPAALNQINGDAEILENLLNNPKLTHHQTNKIFIEILTFHKRATDHLDIDTFQTYQQIIDGAFPLYLKWKSGYDEDIIKCQLKELLKISQDILKPIIEETSEEFLDQINALEITCNNPRFQAIENIPVDSPYTQI